MRLLYVVHSLDIGGTERLVVDLVHQFRREASVTVCCLDRLGVWGEELRRQGIPVICLGRRPGLDLRAVWRLGMLLRRTEAQVVHCHQYPAFFYGVCASLLHRRSRILFTEHGRFHPDIVSLRRRIANRGLAPLTHRFTSVSQVVKQAMVAQEGFPAARIQIIYNGVQPDRFAPSHEMRLSVRRAIGLAADDLIIGTVGRLDPIKDHATLLEAFAQARIRIPAARLLIVGDGETRGALEAQTRRLGLETVVSFLGSREDIPRLLAACDVFALSSRSEGMPVTVLEAMAARLPVIATAVGDIPDLVLDGETGLLCPPGDPGTLSTALVRLLEDRSLRQQMGETGCLRVQREFTRDRMVAGYRQEYLALTRC
ncbi:MAG TPA: glycosyltransferase [Candidatus Acidoferrum sp.]|nr:glycosyltransferase [Candidatus Acidoferrum sp.]